MTIFLLQRYLVYLKSPNYHRKNFWFSFYCYACAESLFNLGEYTKARPYYEQMLTLCHDNEKPDAYYRLGFIYMFQENWISALDNFQSALVYYRQYRQDEKARIAQIRNMINGCVEKIN